MLKARVAYTKREKYWFAFSGLPSPKVLDTMALPPVPAINPRVPTGDLNIIYGLNGSGKTNIIEAIYTLALTKSFRINNDKVMIKKGKIKAKIKGNVLKNGDENTFGVEISNDGKVVTINDERQDKVSDYVSRINVILFNPSDTRLIDEAPMIRRKMLNI